MSTIADILADGMTRVSWVPTISNTSAPTTAELNAGVALESFITPDGLGINTSTDTVDNSALNSTQSTVLPGRRADEVSLTFKQQGQSAAPWTTFASRPSGFLVVRRGVASATAWTAAQKVQVYPCTAGDRQILPPAANELEKFTVPLMVTAAVVDTATVA